MAAYTISGATITGGADAPLVAASEMAFELNIRNDEHDTTTLAATAVKGMLEGLYEWDATITARFNTQILGNRGNVVWPSGYVTNVQSFTLDINTDVRRYAVLAGAAGASYYSFLPGLTSWGGTMEVLADTATGLAMPPARSTSTGATFTVFDGATTDDYTLAGFCFATQLSVSARVGELASATYQFRGDGALTVATGTTHSAQFFANGAIAAPGLGTNYVFTAASGRTYTGKAFRRRISYEVPADGPVVVTLELQGHDSLAIA
jgi:hypothetical protein